MERHGVVVTREGVLQLVDESDVQVDLVIETETKEEAEKLRVIFGTLYREGVYKGMYLSSHIRSDNSYNYGLDRLRNAMRNVYEEMRQKQKGDEYRVFVTKENAEQALRYMHQNGMAIKIIPYKFICALLESLIDQFNARVDPPPPSHPSVRE